MSTASLPPVGPLYGAFYFGVIICTAFYGITCMQTFFFYVHYQNDSTRIKSFVAALWILDTIHESLSVAGVYKYIMAGLVNRASYLYGNPELVLRLLCTVAVALPAQGFFAHRIYLFMNKNIITLMFYVLMALLQFVAAIIYVAKALYSSDGIQVVSNEVLADNTMMTLATVTLSASAATDILIAFFLTFLLARKRTDANFTKSTHILQRLTVFAVNTGIWTATFALLTIILLHAYPTNALYNVPGIPLCPLYCNTVLANLNGRAYAGGETTNVVDVDLFRSASSQQERSGTDQQTRNTSEELSTFANHPQGSWKAGEVLALSDVTQPKTWEGDV